MKNINLDLIGRILIIIGVLTVLSILTYGAFIVHPLLGFSIVGVILIFVGMAIANLS